MITAPALVADSPPPPQSSHPSGPVPIPPLAVVEAIVGHSNPAMTRHYTHVSEAAASTAVNCLPSVMDDAVPVKMLPAVDPVAELKGKIRRLAETLTAKNGLKVKAQLLAAVV